MLPSGGGLYPEIFFKNNFRKSQKLTMKLSATCDVQINSFNLVSQQDAILKLSPVALGNLLSVWTHKLTKRQPESIFFTMLYHFR